MRPDRPRHSPEPETALRRAFHDGSAGAVDTIATTYFADVLRFCVSMIPDEEMAMEALQETFLRVVERHRLYDPARLFRPWLFSVCRNCCLTILRERSTRTASVVEMEDAQEVIAQIPDQSLSGIETLLRDEAQAIALAALAELPEARRTVVFLHLFEDMTFQEIAAITAMPAGSASTLYYRALAQLRKRLHPALSNREHHHAG